MKHAVILIILALFASTALATSPERDEVRDRALGILREGLKSDRMTVRLHAAEALLINGYVDGIKAQYQAEVQQLTSRAASDLSVDEVRALIAARRVLAQVPSNFKKDREEQVDALWKLFTDPAVPQPAQQMALESLCKLGHDARTEEITRLASEGAGRMQAYARWMLANSGKPKDEAYFIELLDSPDAETRGTVSYGLRYFKKISPKSLDRLKKSLADMPSDASGRERGNLLITLFAHAPKGDKPALRVELKKYLDSAQSDPKALAYARDRAAQALAQGGTTEDFPILHEIALDDDLDIRVFAAEGILRVERRNLRGLRWPDYAIIVLYGAVMLGVGIWCSRRQSSTEEYFLASRNMNSWAAGISIFVTLMSTITYLGNPGEMIRYGPMVLLGILVYPVIYFIVGYLLIPAFMKVRVTSAYELLEKRLGMSLRLLASGIFISTRLIWMTVLAYVASRALVVMIGWPVDVTPWVVLGLGILTVLYTSFGGLRAVIITDVLQFIVLFGGALLVIALVTIQMGGFSAWWPTTWVWDPQPIFSLNPTVRATLISSMVAQLVFWICIAGSDQMAVQRYLATRDVKAARHAFMVGLISSFSKILFLGPAGLALLALFSRYPHLMGDAQNVYKDADGLFPHYIANLLPTGLAGLVLCGILAAAMSSLDSGINSIVAVFTRDFLGRFRRQQEGAGGVHSARLIVLGIGTFIVLASSLVILVPGNIVEVSSKTSGLLAAPLFAPFFMALFVPFATRFGTIMAIGSALCTGIVIAYWDLLTGGPLLSFQWAQIMPLPVLMIVGVSVSWIQTKLARPV